MISSACPATYVSRPRKSLTTLPAVARAGDATAPTASSAATVSPIRSSARCTWPCHRRQRTCSTASAKRAPSWRSSFLLPGQPLTAWGTCTGLAPTVLDSSTMTRHLHPVSPVFLIRQVVPRCERDPHLSDSLICQIWALRVFWPARPGPPTDRHALLMAVWSDERRWGQEIGQGGCWSTDSPDLTKLLRPHRINTRDFDWPDRISKWSAPDAEHVMSSVNEIARGLDSLLRSGIPPDLVRAIPSILDVPCHRALIDRLECHEAGGSFSRMSRAIHVSAALSVAKPRRVLRAPLSLTTATLKSTPLSVGRTVYLDILAA
jgi:hypothetical protein